MTDLLSVTRRTGRTGSTAPATWVWLLSRPLAADDQRARFWCRHLRLGIVLSQLAAAVVIAYAWPAHRPAAGTLTLLCLGVMLTTPALFALPMQTLSRDHRGVLIFYAWSSATTLVIALLAIVDGGGRSPLAWLLVLTLTYAAWAYPPMGVALMGTVMVGAYLAIVLANDPLTVDNGLPAAVLALFTMMIAWAARNHWDLADQQRPLAERLATLADTDELTATLNRRALAARLERALSEASDIAPVAVCIIDLDGFKEVNDRRGHDAGDAVLRAVAEALLVSVRETDSVGRIGGDEFAVLLPGSDSDDAVYAAQRLCDAVAAAGGPDGVTASVGLAVADLPCAGGRPAGAGGSHDVPGQARRWKSGGVADEAGAVRAVTSDRMQRSSAREASENGGRDQRSATGEETRTRIMTAAERLIARNGLDGVSIRDITDEAKVNSAAIHYHFRSKRGLIEAMLARWADELVASRGRMLDKIEAKSEPALRDVVEVLVLPMVELAGNRRRGGARYVGFLAAVVNHPEYIPLMNQLYEPDISRTLRLLEQVTPQLSSDVRMLRWAIAKDTVNRAVSTATSPVHLWLKVYAPGASDQLGDRLVDFLVGAFSAPETA